MKTTILLLALAMLMATAAAAQNTGIGTNNPTDQLHTTGTVRFEGYHGPGTRLVQIDSLGRMQVTGSGVVASNTTIAAIPDNGCATGNGLTSTINVIGQSGSVSSTKISVRLDVTHGRLSDLSVFLLAPNGALLRLMEGNGGTAQNLSGTIYSDEAVGLMPATSNNSFNGTFKPKSGVNASCLLTPSAATFGAIGGGSIIPNGSWTLKVFDNASGVTGTLNKWEISFSGPLSFGTQDENNYIPKLSGGGLLKSVLYNDAGGYVGINTTAPQYPLTIVATNSGIVHKDNTYGVAIGTYTSSVSGILQTYTNHPLGFATNNNLAQMELSTAGNLGVGITAAAARLHVYAAANPLAIFENATALATGVSNDIYFKTGGNYTGSIRARGTASNAAALAFSTYTTTSSAGLQERLTILDNGYVGIGNTAPTAKLDVAGSLRIEGGTPAAGKVLTATDALGDATWQAPPKVSFRAVLPNNITVNAGALTPASGYTEYLDEGADFNPVTGTFTAPVTGLYHFEANFRIVEPAGGDVYVYETLNCSNSAVIPATVGVFSRDGHVETELVSVDYLLTAGDQISVSLVATGYNPFIIGSVVNPNSGYPTVRSSFCGHLVHQ